MPKKTYAGVRNKRDVKSHTQYINTRHIVKRTYKLDHGPDIGGELIWGSTKLMQRQLRYPKLGKKSRVKGTSCAQCLNQVSALSRAKVVTCNVVGSTFDRVGYDSTRSVYHACRTTILMIALAYPTLVVRRIQFD